MKLACSILAPLCLVTALAACGGDATGPATGTSGAVSAKAKSSAAPAARGSAAPTASAAPTEAAKPSAAASFAAQPVPKPFDTLTIGAPTGAKLETGVTKDYAMIEGPDYAFKIEEEKENEIPKLKEMMSKAGAKFIVDQPDGLVFEMKDKDETSLNVLRYLKIGDKGYSCSTTSKGAPKSPEKAQEAYDVCGTLKAK